MSTEPIPPEPEQIVPSGPPSRQNVLLMALGVIALLIAGILVLRVVLKPGASSDADLAALPILGDPHAPLTIFEYASLACEHCAHVQPVLKEVMARYDGRVKLVYIHFPPGQQPVPTRAAMAGVCAAEQGKFWPFAELMFERQNSWSKDPNPQALWLLYAQQAGMDTNVFVKCLDSPATEQAVSQQMMMGAGQMVQATPTFLIGDSRLVNPQSIEPFLKVIDKELAALKTK